MFELNTPVLFIIFNRPDFTQLTFDEIRKARPPKLFVVADGPRSPEESYLCDQCREIAQNVDWPCTVLTNFSDVNMGCKDRVASGITWALSQTEDVIILEDDCLPDPSFFRFCQELLEKYRFDGRIAMVSGTNYGDKVNNHSYFLTKIGFFCGWATWKRAWDLYDHNMSDFRDEDCERRLYEDGVLNRKAWTWIFNRTFNEKINSWGYRWNFSIWKNQKYSLVSNANLIKNIGYDDRASHTRSKSCHLANRETESVTFPLSHPPMITDSEVDKKLEHTAFTWWFNEKIYR